MLNIADIEAKQLSNTSIGTAEISKDNFIKQASIKSIDEFDIEGASISTTTTPSPAPKTKTDVIKETTSENSADGQDSSTPLNKKSSAFIPKNKLGMSRQSSKVDGDDTDKTSKSTLSKSSLTKSLNAKSEKFVPSKLKLGRKEYVPPTKKVAPPPQNIQVPAVQTQPPAQSLSQTVNPNYRPPMAQNQPMGQNYNQNAQNMMGRVPINNQNGAPSGPPNQHLPPQTYNQNNMGYQNKPQMGYNQGYNQGQGSYQNRQNMNKQYDGQYKKKDYMILKTVLEIDEIFSFDCVLNAEKMYENNSKIAAKRKEIYDKFSAKNSKFVISNCYFQIKLKN